MSTNLAASFLSQPDWWITTGREPFPSVPGFHGAKDCTLTADVNPGVYFLVLGNGGIDSGHRSIRVATTSAAPVTCKIVDVDNTHKTLTFQDSTGAGTAPDQISVAVRRLV